MFSPCANIFSNDIVVGISVAAAVIKTNTRIDEITIVE
jgi:hypothetical protein